MSKAKTTSLKKPSFNLSEWIDSSSGFENLSNTINISKRSIRRNVKGIWSKRLELLFGFIPALLVFMIAYGKKFHK